MRLVALTGCAVSLLLAAPTKLWAQGGMVPFGEQPQPDVHSASDPTPTPPLFVPIQPGQPAAPPPPRAMVVPQQAAPAGQTAPGAPVFIPADIPPPAIQSTGETIDFVPTPGPLVPLADPVTPIPAPGASPAPAPRKRTAPAKPQTVSQGQISKWVAQATDKRDANLATQIGWAYFNREEFSSAGVWFNQALEWNPKLGEAGYGLALCKFREGDLSSAEAIVNYRQGSYPKMKTLQGDIYSRRGTEAYEAKNYAASLEYFNKAAAARPLSRNEQIIVAWDLYYTKQYEQSANLFEKLYRASPDNVTAQGLYVTLSRLKATDRLDAIAAEVPGPLGETYMTYGAKEYFSANLFVAAADSGGANLYPVLQNLNTPSVAVGLGYRSKSGAEGEGQLQVTTFPAIQAQVFPANKFILSGYLAHLNLDSGDLPTGAQFGNIPQTPQDFSYEPNTSESDLWDFALRLEYQDWISWYVTFGTTPLNGPLQSLPTGNAGLIWRDAKGYVQGEFYSKSIKESITSWVGSVDPYTGQKWGRVTETGGAISFFRSIGEDNTIFARASYGSIKGTNVRDNEHLSGVVAVSHLFDVPGYEYVTLGFALSYEQFDNNQNRFTYGNGGYFSPQYLLQGLIQAQFLTEEGKNWLAAGSAGVGIQNNKQDASPYYPLDDDGQRYDAQESTTGIGLIQVQGGYLFNDQWMVGGSFGYNITADYNEGFLSIYVRYMFERRNGLLRTDLLGFEF